MTTHRTRHARRRHALTGAGALAALGLLASACTPPAATTTRASVTASGQQADGGSNQPSITADGRFVAFQSRASNLGGGGFSTTDVFLKDRQTGAVILVSRASGVGSADGDSVLPSVSNDGSRIAFRSLATNIAGGGPSHDIFLQLRGASTTNTFLVTEGVDGRPSNGFSTGADVSGDGDQVAFQSGASNLVPGDTNDRDDVFVYDIGTDAIRRVSRFEDGRQLGGGAISPAVSNLGHVAFITDTRLLPDQDTDGTADVYVADASGDLALASPGPGEAIAPAVDISDDGRFVAFVFAVGSGPQTWVRDLATGQLTLVSHVADGSVGGNGPSASVAISPDGTHVAFSSAASDLVPGDTNGRSDSFVARRDGTGLVRTSVRSDGRQSSGDIGALDVSNEGREVAFSSPAADLVDGDTSGLFDVFVHDRG